MMNYEKQNQIEVRESKTGNPVPVVNGVHLHSSYNPTKEAESFVEKFEAVIQENRNILVLGLGFAYHIDRIVYQMKRFWGDDFKIMVIDPLNETEELLREKRNVDYGNNVILHSGLTVGEVYDNRDIVDFLSTKPTVIPHTASFNLFQDYFKALMSFTAKSDLNSISNHIKNTDLKKYILSQETRSYFELINSVNSKKTKWNKWDYLTLALNSISSPENTTSREEK
jgi:hypothetical protein